MKIIIQKFTDLNNQEIRIEPPSTELLDLFYKMQLPQYYKIFVDNGFDCIQRLKLITIENLDYLGITKIGHQKQIMCTIENLNIL